MRYHLLADQVNLSMNSLQNRWRETMLFWFSVTNLPVARKWRLRAHPNPIPWFQLGHTKKRNRKSRLGVGRRRGTIDSKPGQSSVEKPLVASCYCDSFLDWVLGWPTRTFFYEGENYYRLKDRTNKLGRLCCCDEHTLGRSLLSHRSSIIKPVTSQFSEN
jgi:hypothetical protein